MHRSKHNRSWLFLRLQLIDIQNTRLQHIYNDEMEELEKNFSDVKKIFDQRTFKYEVLIAFWLCIHLEKLELAQFIMTQDTIIDKILANLKKKEPLNFSKTSKSKNAIQESKRQGGVLSSSQGDYENVKGSLNTDE